MFLQFLISSLTAKCFAVDQGVLAGCTWEPWMEDVLFRGVTAGEGNWRQRLGAVGGCW